MASRVRNFYKIIIIILSHLHKINYLYVIMLVSGEDESKLEYKEKSSLVEQITFWLISYISNHRQWGWNKGAQIL